MVGNFLVSGGGLKGGRCFPERRGLGEDGSPAHLPLDRPDLLFLRQLMEPEGIELPE